MASCAICSGANKKLFKGSYYSQRIFVCKHCVIAYGVDLEEEKESA